MSVAAPPAREAAAAAAIAPVLVAPAWLRAHLAAVHVLDVRAASEFATAHLPGAQSLPLDALVIDDSSSDALHRLAHAVGRALANRGVAPTDHVVLVDAHEDGSAALGGVLCELAGMTRVSVLLGGFATWAATGGASTADAPTATQQRPDWSSATPNLAGVAPFEALTDAVDDHTAHVLDVRSQLEHEGIVGAPCCAARGCIPDSLHLEWTNFFDLSGAPRLASDVRGVLAQVGIDPHDDVILTCHVGRRSAAAAAILRASGVTNVRVSLGSWHEWSQRRAAASAGDAGQAHPHAHA